MRWLTLACLTVVCLALSRDKRSTLRSSNSQSPSCIQSRENCYTFTDDKSLCAQKFTLPTDCLVFGNGSVVCVRLVKRTEKRSSPRQMSAIAIRSRRRKARFGFIPFLPLLAVPKLAAIIPGAAIVTKLGGAILPSAATVAKVGGAILPSAATVAKVGGAILPGAATMAKIGGGAIKVGKGVAFLTGMALGAKAVEEFVDWIG